MTAGKPRAKSAPTRCEYELNIRTTFEGAGVEYIRNHVVPNWIADWNLRGVRVTNPNDLVSLELGWAESLIGNVTTVRYGEVNEINPQRPQDTIRIEYAEYEGPNVSIKFTAKGDSLTIVSMQAKLVCTRGRQRIVEDLVSHMSSLTRPLHGNITATCEAMINDGPMYRLLSHGALMVTEGVKTEPKDLTAHELRTVIEKYFLSQLV